MPADSSYPKPESGTHQAKNENYKLYFHARGTAQSEDRLVYEDPDQPKWGFFPEVTEDGRYLVISVWQGSQREVAIYYRDLEKGGDIVKMLPDFDADYSFLGNDGTTFWFKTDAGASNGRIVGIDCTNPKKEAWTEIVPEQKETFEEA